MNSFDPLDLRAQEKALADNSERNKLTHQTEQEDFKWLMGNKRGRRIVWRLLERTGVYRSSFNRPVFIHHIVAANTVDELVMARRETKREVQDLLLEAMKR